MGQRANYVQILTEHRAIFGIETVNLCKITIQIDSACKLSLKIRLFEPLIGRRF